MEFYNYLNKKNFLIFLVLVNLIVFSFFLISPTFAWAYEDSEKIMEAGFDATNLFTAVFNVGLPKFLFLQPSLTLFDLASEFFSTITGNNLFTEGIDSSNFSKVYSFVGGLAGNGTYSLQPIGYLIVGICAGIEGLRICKDSKGLSTQWLGLGLMEAWFVYALKFYVLYSLVANAKELMLAIYSIVMAVQNVVSSAIKVSQFDNGSVVFDSVKEFINNITIGDGTGVCFVVFITAIVCLIVCALTAIYIQVLSVMRIFEIFILMAISPITLGAAASTFTSDVTKTYIKTFISAVLQLTVILLIVAIFGPLMTGITSSLNNVFNGDTGVNTILKAVVPIVTSLSLFLMVKKSRQISNNLVGLA